MAVLHCRSGHPCSTAVSVERRHERCCYQDRCLRNGSIHESPQAIYNRFIDGLVGSRMLGD